MKPFSRVGALALVLAAGSAAPAGADFAYTDFTSAAGLSFNGSATHSAPTLSVTPPIRASAGSVWRSDPQTVSGGFVSNFTFRISDISGGGSDGLAFVLHNDPRAGAAIGGSGGAMGYATNTVYPTQTGIANGLAVEFDSWNNEFNWSDFNSDQCVSVQSMGQLTMVPSGLSSLGHSSGVNFADGAVHTARIVYAPGTLEVFLDNMVTPMVSVSVDLSSILALDNERAFVGFTAGTGSQQDAERHGILSWDFTSTTVPTPGAAALLIAGGACVSRRRRKVN